MFVFYVVSSFGVSSVLGSWLHCFEGQGLHIWSARFGRGEIGALGLLWFWGLGFRCLGLRVLGLEIGTQTQTMLRIQSTMVSPLLLENLCGSAATLNPI